MLGRRFTSARTERTHAVRTTQWACLTALVTLLLGASPAAAQRTGDGFLFKAPAGAVTVRGGLNRATAGSDVFTFVTEQLTVNRHDFRAMTFASDISVGLTPQLAFLVGMSFARSVTPSEFRDWLDNRNLPIEQTTTLLRVPVTAGVKFYFREPGRSVGRFAWIPARFAPYVGGAGGLMLYELRQAGDFVDFATFKVFYDKYESKDVRPVAQAFAGLDVSIHPRLALTTEARYDWARAPLSTDFSGFDPIDLSGVSVTAGFSFRY